MKDILKLRIERMTDAEVEWIIRIFDEYEQAKIKHPNWPKDGIHRAAIVAEEAGELIKACLQYEYETGNIMEIRDEAVQTGAMAFRFLTQLTS